MQWQVVKIHSAVPHSNVHHGESLKSHKVNFCLFIIYCSIYTVSLNSFCGHIYLSTDFQIFSRFTSASKKKDACTCVNYDV